MMSTMNNRRIPKLRINETMIEGIHYEIYKSTTGGTGSMKGCVMMSIDFAPPGGLTEEEIKTIKDHVVQDPTNDYYAIGLETTRRTIRDNEGKDTIVLAIHMHIRLVKKETTVVKKQKLVFHPFLAKGRCVWVDDNKKKECYSLKIDVCEKKYRPTQTPIKQMAYAMKESMGEYNNGITHWSNLLEDYDGSAQWCEDKAILDATVNKSKKKKEQRGEYNITVESQNSMAKKYAQLNGLEWSMDNHLEILATMLTDMTGPNAYYLSGIIQLPVKVRKRLGRLKGNDNYKEEYLEALEADAEKTGGISTKQQGKLMKKITRELEKAKRINIKLTNVCKQHLATIDNFKSVPKQIAYHDREFKRLLPQINKLYGTERAAFYEHKKMLAKFRAQKLSLMRPVDVTVGADGYIIEAVVLEEKRRPLGPREISVGSPQILGRKRPRVEEPIPEKSADHKRQDALMAMKEW